MNKIGLVVLSALAVYFAAITPADSQDGDMYFELSRVPTDLQVSVVDGSVVVSAGDEIHRLYPNLTLINTIRTHDRKAGHRIALSHNNTGSVLVCKETYCTFYNFDWLFGDTLIQPKRVNAGYNSFPLSIEPDGFYTAGCDGVSVAVEQFDEYFDSVRSYEWPFLPTINFKRHFLYGFVYRDFVYFITRDNGTTLPSNNVRLLRYCHELPSDDDNGAGRFDAAYETILECGEISASSKVIVSTTPLDEFGNALITLAVTTNEATTICSFSLSDIDAEMDSSFTQCSNNNSLVIPLVWFRERTCAAFSDSVSSIL